MSVTAAQADAKFLLKFDLYSAYFTPTQRSKILTEALSRTVENKYKEFQGTQKVTEELSDLLVTVTGAPTNPAYHNKPATLRYLLDIRLQYASGKNKKATLYREGDADDLFEEATETYPKVTNRIDKLHFLPTGVTGINLTYLKNPDAIELVAGGAAVLPISDRLVDVMVDEAVKIASAITREQNNYAVQDKEIKDNN